MSGKEKPGVTRRLNRGRSAPDAKCKTDSGCFVDEELERNGSASSDSSQGSINSSPVTELDSQRTKVINKKRKDNITASVASSSEPKVENEANRTSDCMQNVMSKEAAVNDQIECAHTHDEDRGGNVVEKTRRASDFYCLYYSASPESTLTRCGVNKVRSKPPVPPKPKLRRGSAPPSSFEKIERIQQQNKDITKRFSYNECQNASVRPECTEVDNFPDCDKWKSVEEHVLFFEACVKDGLTERNDFLKNVQAKTLKNSSEEACVGNTEVNVEIHNGFHCFDDDQSSTEDVAPIVDTERFSFENNNVCESVIFNRDAQEQIPPLVEEEEFTVDGSILSQSSINSEPLNSNCHHSKIERDCLDSVSELDEVDYADHVVVDDNQEGVSSSFDETERQYSDPLGLSETDVYVNGIVSNTHNVFEFVDASEARDSNLPDHAKTHCRDIHQLSCSSRTVPSVETTSGIDFKEILVNPRLSEIKQSSLPGFRQWDRNIRQRRPGSIAGIPNLERDLSTEMKRRSWSFSETHPLAVNSPLEHNVHQAHTRRLRTTWQSENGLSSPSVSLFHQNRPMLSSINTISQEKMGWSSSKRIGQSHFDQSGYTSDDGSVHSEPLFQPQRRRPQSLAHGHIFKSMSCDSSISDMDKRRFSFPESQQKRFHHSLGSRDPVFALRRQSFEFSEDPPPFQQIRAPCLQNLRRTSSNASSSSDSEVERIFSEPSAPRYWHPTKTSIHNGFASSKPVRKVSAVEALFGPRSTSPLVKNVTLSSELEEMGPKTFSDKYSVNSSLSLAEDFLPEELEEEMAAITDPKEIEEPRLEFDDTDYSEFYTRCEDKDSIISAEALSIKKLLESPQTVLPDRDIESVVMSVTEKKTFSPSSDDKHKLGCQEELNDSDMDDDEQAISEDENSRQFYRWHRGTQTPPADVFRALSPSPSVGTQTPPLSVSQELLPPSLLKELQKDLQSSVPSKGSKAVSPTSSQELYDQLSLLGNVHAASYTAVAFADTDRTSSQDNDKAVSIEELLQILATMKVGSTEDVPKRRPVSVQRYNHSPTPPLNVKSRPNTNSLPSSWHHLNSPVQRQNGSQDLKLPRTVPPRSSKSFDCLRQGVRSKDKTSGVTQAEAVRGSTSNEDIRKKLKEWTSARKSQLFEEEVECLEEKRKATKANEEKTLKVSYNGSEATDNIETLSRLTKTHSLKRPRRDRAFSQREKNGLEVNSLDEKRRFSLPTPKAKPCDEERKGDVKLEDPVTSSATEDSKFKDILFDSLDAEEIVTEGQLQEIASPEGVDVFIDYRKKNGLHITSTPKPPPYPGNSLVFREDGVGKNNINKTDVPHNEKPASVKGAEDVPTDVESQGDASSSSYSSDDDHFGEFGGSTDTVVFVDTEASTGISLVADLDTMDLKLVGNDNLLSVDNNDDDDDDDDEQDEASLDALLGEVRRSLNLEVVDSDILDKAIERFKQRVSPSSQDKALSGGLSMEACVALHQADELQGIISEIKGELKLLHEENDMLREQVSTLANHQTNGEVSENSSTESSERLENLYKLYRPKHVNSDDDEGDAVEVDVCLRGFSTVTLGGLPSKKEDIHLGIVTVKGADWNGVMEAARRMFVDHVNKIDPDGYLCLGAHSIQGVQTGVMLWSPDSLRKSSPRVELSKKSNPCIVQLKDGSHFSCDSLVYDTLLPKETIEKYVEDLLEHRHIVLCGQQSLGKSYLAAKLAEHIVQRVGWKCSPAVVTFNVSQSTRKELKQSLASFMQSDISSPQEGSPAVIVLEQLNCLATLASIFDLSILDNKNCPYIIGVRDKSRRGPFSSKELNLCHYFRWLRVSVNDRQYSGLLGRFLRRKLSWAQIQTDVEGSGKDLLDLFDWLSKVWYHLNEILEEYCEPDSTIGPSLFFSCPMDYKAAEGWFVNVWNYNVIPYLHQVLRSGRKIFDRSITWEDPTKWVILRYPWNKDHSRFLHTLRKLRQVDVVLNRNHLGSDNVCFAECIEENEKILRARSTVSKRVRTVVQQKVPKGELTTRRNAAEQKRLLGNEEDKDSCYSETDSYLETSI